MRYTVQQITQELERVIGDRYPSIDVVGEISQLTLPASGHAYLALAEGEAILNAVVWRSTWATFQRKPVRGDKVVCRGRLGLYPGKSQYQLFVHAMFRAGEGQLAAEIARRRARLEAEGLLDPRRKRALPRLPRYVGVATSLTGAALQDFLKVSRERCPSARILVSGCMVQGPTAPASVVAAVELLLEDGRAEVIVVTRGGGSKDDLMAFQDEDLARFLAHCPVPVVSAVGHQIDTTLADLVADVVAPTPTGAAVVALPDAGAWAQRVDDHALRLQARVEHLLARRRQAVTALRHRVRHPGERIAAVRQRARELEARLEGRMVAVLRARRAKVEPLPGRMERAVVSRLPWLRERVLRDGRRLATSAAQAVRTARARVDVDVGRLGALSPTAVLDRGYAVVVGDDGLVTDAAQVAAGQRLRVRLRRGAIAVVVDDPAEGP